MDNIKTTLLHYTPKEILIEAMSMPYQTENFKKVSTEDAMKKIKSICIDKKHESVLEHIIFTFKIEGISRLCLQELVRHRMASYTVQSTRFTLPNQEEWKQIEELCLDLLYNDDKNKNKYNDIITKYIVIPYNFPKYEHYKYISEQFSSILLNISDKQLDFKMKNDMLKYLIPESWRTNLVMSINMRSLRNFLQLRLSKQAHFEIRHLANLILEQIPEEYKILFNDLSYREN